MHFAQQIKSLSKYVKNHHSLLVGIAIVGILLIAAIARLTLLSQFPPLLQQDEATLGYNAVSIAKTGKDEWGASFPFVFKSFGDDKPPVFFYVTAGLYFLFGWVDTLPRLTSAIAGICTVFLTIVWIRKLLRSEVAALIAGLCVALSPWAIHLSRMALESNLALTFFMLALLVFEYAKSNGKFRYYFSSLAALCFALSAYTYVSFRFVIILFLASIFAIQALTCIRERKFQFHAIFIVSVMTAVLLLPGILNGGSFTRYNQTALISDETVGQQTFFNLNSCHMLSYSLNVPVMRLICKAVWNKVTIPVIILAQSFINHLSPNFLFFNGDFAFTRNPVQTGAFSVFLLPFFYVGIAQSIRFIKKYYTFLLGFLISILPSVLTSQPHAIRLSPSLPFVIFFIAYGWLAIYKHVKYLPVITVIFLFASFGWFSIRYTIDTYAGSQEFVQYGKEVSIEAYRYYQEGYTVYLHPKVMVEPHMYFAYWNHIDPTTYQNFDKAAVTDSYGFTRPTQLGDRISFVEFDYGDIICSEKANPKTVFITPPDTLPFGSERVVRNATGSQKYASFYTLQGLKSDKSRFVGFCAQWKQVKANSAQKKNN